MPHSDHSAAPTTIDSDAETQDVNESLIAHDVAVIPAWMDQLASAVASLPMDRFEGQFDAGAGEKDDRMAKVAGLVLAAQEYAETVGLPCALGRHSDTLAPALLMGEVAVNDLGVQPLGSVARHEPLDLLAVDEVYIEWGRQVIALAIEQSHASLAWPQLLRDNGEISSFMAENSSHEIDEEMLLDYFHSMQAVLVRLPTLKVAVDESRADNNMASAKNEKRFLKLPADTVPPVILNESGVLEDGHHRQRVALKRGDPWMWAYLPVHEDVDLKPYFGKSVKNSASRSPS